MRSHRRLTFATLALTCLAAAAAENIEVCKDGRIELPGNITLGMQHYAPDWKLTYQTEASIELSSDSTGNEIKGIFTVANGAFNLEEKVHSENDESLTCSWQVSSSTPVETTSLSATFHLPFETFFSLPVLIDGNSVELVPDPKSKTLLTKSFQKLEIPGSKGRTLVSMPEGQTGNLYIYGYKDSPFQIRVFFTPRNEAITKAGLQLSIKSIPFLSTLPFSDNWSLFAGVRQPATFATVPGSLSSPNGDTVPPQTVRLEKNTINIADITKRYSRGDCAVLYNVFDCPKAGDMRLGFAADWWMEIYLNGEQVYSTMAHGNGTHAYTPDDHAVLVSFPKGKNVLAAKVLSGSEGWRFVAGIPSPAPKPIVYAANDEWKAVDMSAILVKDGTALDLSGNLDAPAGKYGRIVVGKDGLLTFENAPSKIARFHAFSGPINRSTWYNIPEEEFHEKIRLLADQAVRLGYNFFRIHQTLDTPMCWGAKEPLSINADSLDRWDYIISEFKKRGIYVQPLILAYGLHSNSPKEYSETLKNSDRHKLMMYLGNEYERTRFRYGAETLLNHVNPYTGLAWKDDPCIALVEFYNEQYAGTRVWQIIEEDAEARALLNDRWRAWLSDKFKDEIPGAIREELEGKALDQASVPDMRRPKGALANEFALFCQELVKNNNLWYEKVLQENGYTGLVTQNGSGNLFFTLAGWETLPVIDNHTYAAHPSNGRVNPGARISQQSSIESQGRYWRAVNAERSAGRPVFVGEFNHGFWNPYVYEAGLLFSAYAALQGYSSIAIHQNAVELTVKGYMYYNFLAAENPICRANEFLRSCLFKRGDVRRSSKRVRLSIPEEYYSSNANSWKAVSSEQSKLGLVTGFSLEFPWAKRAAGTAAPGKADMTLDPSSGALVFNDQGGWFSSVIDSKDTAFSLDACVKEMKKNGVLPESNITDPLQGIFQSDTGEITMRAEEKLLKVVTPGTEGVCIMAGKSETLGQMTVNSASSQGCVAITSVDGKNLSDSARMVLVYNTEVVNTGMELSANRVEMLKVGHAPTLMRTGKLDVTLRTANRGLRCYALAFDGTRREELPLSYENGLTGIRIDTTLLKDGPTPFFELVRE